MANAAKSPIQPYIVNGRAGGVRLCQFFNNSAELLHGHKSWIDTHFVPKMKQNPNAWIDIYGHTSRLGSDAANHALSDKRLAAVERYIKHRHPGINVNIRGAQGEEDAASFSIEQKDNDGYWRAVMICWFGIPLDIPTPEYPEEKPPFHFTPAPKGCWLITGVDTYGLPIHGPISGGQIKLSLLNDQGELYAVYAYGASVGAEIKADGGEAVAAGANAVKGLGSKLYEFGKGIVFDVRKAALMKAGDLQNISDNVKKAGITGPSGTTGGVMRGGKWAANLKFADIIKQKSFIITNAELQMVMGGGEMGLILFGGLMDGPSAPWGYYQSLGLATFKAGGGIAATLYKITRWEKVSDAERLAR